MKELTVKQSWVDPYFHICPKHGQENCGHPDKERMFFHNCISMDAYLEWRGRYYKRKEK